MAEALISTTGDGLIVSAEWLLSAIDEPQVKTVDARSARQYARGHVPRALNSDQNLLRMPDSAPSTIKRFQEIATAEIRRLGLPKTDKVIFYEAVSGASAARGVWMLDYLGLEGGAMLDGGLVAWVESGGELTREVTSIAPGMVETQPDPGVLASAQEVLSGLTTADSGLVVLDTRSDLENRTGTLPTSIHIEWLRHLDPNGKFLPRTELEKLFRSRGFDGGLPIRSCHFAEVETGPHTPTWL